MLKHVSLCALLLVSSACWAADLTETERRWIQGAWPVIAYAKAAELPLDIVVQPQPAPGAAPLAMGFIDGRCKLVLSMRGNPEALSTLERLDPATLNVTLELMAAHELAHCWRYVHGAWYALPAGFTAASAPDGLAAELRDAYADMQAARREEGFADLAGLAWVQQRHPQQYAALHAWLVAERSKDRIAGSHHDTLAWLRLAADGSVFADAAVFAEGSARLWAVGLAADD